MRIVEAPSCYDPHDPLLTPSKAAERLVLEVKMVRRDAFMGVRAMSANVPATPPKAQADEAVLWSEVPFEGWPRRISDALYRLGIRRWRDLAATDRIRLLMEDRLGRCGLAFVERRMRDAGVVFDRTLPRPTPSMHPLGAPATSGVYFVRCREFIKIGSTGNARKRLASLSVSIPYELDLLAFLGTPDRQSAYVLEKRLHEQFASCRFRGEWFRDHADIRAFILASTKPKKRSAA